MIRISLILLLLVILTGVVLLYGSWRFNRRYEKELKMFMASAKAINQGTVTEEKLAALPPPVKKWLERTRIAGKEFIHTVRLEQEGEMLSKPGGKWMPFQAVQFNKTDQPGFMWKVKVKAAPLLNMTGVDKYDNGKGHMLIKLLSLIPVADARGETIDQGSLLRYLGEVVWFPSAALCDYITWEPLDSRSAKATMSYGGVTASGILRFDPKGDPLSFEADRYFDRNGSATLEKWLVTNAGFREFGGIRIPSSGEVTWKLKTGDYTWFRFRIKAVEYNPR